MEESIKLLKLKFGEDIVCFLKESDTHYTIRRPISVFMDTDMESGRQFLNVREWFPPLIVVQEEVIIPKNEVLFAVDVKEEFHSEFVTLSDMFFNMKQVKKKEKKSTESANDKVVPFGKLH